MASVHYALFTFLVKFYIIYCIYANIKETEWYRRLLQLTHWLVLFYICNTVTRVIYLKICLLQLTHTTRVQELPMLLMQGHIKNGRFHAKGIEIHWILLHRLVLCIPKITTVLFRAVKCIWILIIHFELTFTIKEKDNEILWFQIRW